MVIIMKNLPLDTGMIWSSYTNLEQIPISAKYSANSSGIFEEPKHLLICEPITFKSINRDRKNGNEFVEISFIDYSTGKATVKTLQVETAMLFEKEGIAELRRNGFNIVNVNKFTEFISTTKANLNRLSGLGIETKVERYFGSSQYGLEDIDGQLNYDNFIGLDNPPIPSREFKKYDDVLFKTKGTLEGQINYLKKFSEDSKNLTIIKTCFAAALTGVTRQFLKNKEDVPRPVYIFTAETGYGKGYLLKNGTGCWGNNTSVAPLGHNSKTSQASARRIKSRLGVIPYWIDDLQNIIDDTNGKEQCRDMVYEHANGTGIGRANSNGTLREDNGTWEGPMIAFAENDDMNFLRDGGNTRFIQYNAKKSGSEMIYGDIAKKYEINKMQDENYGHIAPAYIRYIREYIKTYDITYDFIELSNTYKNKLDCNDKIASLYALIDITYNLAYKFGLCPAEWKELTIEENIKDYDFERTTSSAEDLYTLLKERILSQTNIYISINEKLGKKDYEDRMNINQAVRGRIEIKDLEDGRRVKNAIIPVDIVNRNINDLEKTFGMPLKPISTKTWLEKGWLVKNKKGFATYNCTNITRQFIKGESKQENCYKIFLEDLTPTPEEKVEEEKAAAAAREAQLEKERKIIAEIKEKQKEYADKFDLPF
jgi:hypothetical protein